MSEVWVFLCGLIPSIITGMVVYYFQRAQKKRDEKEDGRENARRREMRLILDLLLATGELTSAVAIAIKRGHANGEVEKGLESFEKAKEEFQDFERDQVARL